MRGKDQQVPILNDRGQSTAEYALMVFWVMLALMATFKVMQDAISFFCRYVVSVISLPVP
jgi:hypothetical protein